MQTHLPRLMNPFAFIRKRFVENLPKGNMSLVDMSLDLCWPSLSKGSLGQKCMLRTIIVQWGWDRGVGAGREWPWLYSVDLGVHSRSEWGGLGKWTGQCIVEHAIIAAFVVHPSMKTLGQWSEKISWMIQKIPQGESHSIGRNPVSYQTPTARQTDASCCSPEIMCAFENFQHLVLWEANEGRLNYSL